jgi:hypothetical protein
MEERIQKALDIAAIYGGIDGSHHKAWVIDQMVRSLTACPMVPATAKDCRGEEYSFWRLGESDEYREFIRSHNEGEDGPETYEWDEGITP